MEPPGLASAVGTRLSEAGGNRDRRPAQAAGSDLELVALGDRCLVDVAGEDQLGARVDERREHMTAACDRLLARAPGCSDQVVVKRHDPKRALGRLGEQLPGPLQLRRANTAGLVTPGADRV